MVFDGALRTFSKLTSKNRRAQLRRLFPISQWLLHYKMQDLRYDIIAGFTVGLTLVPQCMAYAQMASVKPLYGLYSSFLGQFIYVILGTAKDAAVGPSAIVSMMVGNFNAANPKVKEGDNTYSCIMAFMSGLILMLIGFLRLGFIVNLFSIPVVNGFTCAAGFTIFASQLKPFFGLSDAPNDSPSVFVKQIINVVNRHSEIKTVDVIFGSMSIAFLLFGQYIPDAIERATKYYNQRKHDEGGKLRPGQVAFMEYLRLVAASRNVVVFIFTTLAAFLLIRADPSFENRITIVKRIEPGIPPPRFPALTLTDSVYDNVTNQTLSKVVVSTSEMFLQLTISFVIVPLMIMLEQFAILKALGRKNGYRIDATNELLAVGLANFVQSFFQAFPVTTAVTRCALNDQCKVKTQLGSIISAVIVIVAISALTETFYYIPKASLAAIIMTAAYNLVDFSIVKSMWQEYRRDVFIFFLTFLLCLFFDMAYGILIMILVNMITFLRPIVRMALVVSLERHEGKSQSVTVVKLSHGMKYPSADKFLDRMSRVIARAERHVILDCQFFTGIDYTGFQALRGIILLAYRQNKHLIFTNMSEHLLKKVEKIGIDNWLYVDSVKEAVSRFNKAGDSHQASVQIEVVHHSHPPPEVPHEQVLTSAPHSMSFVGTFIHHRKESTISRRVSRVSVKTGDATEQEGVNDGSIESVNDDETSVHPVEWEKKQEEILKHLTAGQAHFYQNIPIANVIDIGNVLGKDVFSNRDGDSMRFGDGESSSSDDGNEQQTKHSELELESYEDQPRKAAAKKLPLFSRSLSAIVADEQPSPSKAGLYGRKRLDTNLPKQEKKASIGMKQRPKPISRLVDSPSNSISNTGGIAEVVRETAGQNADAIDEPGGISIHFDKGDEAASSSPP